MRRPLSPAGHGVRLFGLGLVATWVLTGCGSSPSEQAKVEKVARSYSAALADGDGIRACALLTQRAAQRLTASLRRGHPELDVTDCASAVDAISENLAEAARTQLRDLKPTVTVEGTRATATVEGGSRPLKLVKQDGDWLISSGIS